MLYSGDRLRTARWLLLVAVAALGSFLAGLVLPRIVGLSLTVFSPPPIRSSGVVTLNRGLADDGFVTVGSLQDDKVKLINHEGNVVHTWDLGYPLAGMATMGSAGNLIYLGQLPEWTANPASQPGIGGIAGVVRNCSWDGHVVWSLEDRYVSHDFAQLPDGEIATLEMAPVPPEVAQQIPGGIPDSEQGGRMWEDQIIEIDPVTGAERVVFDPGST